MKKDIAVVLWVILAYVITKKTVGINVAALSSTFIAVCIGFYGSRLLRKFGI